MEILHSTIKLMFRVPSDEILEILFKKAINDYNGNRKCVSALVKVMEKKYYWVCIILITLKEHSGYVVLPGLSPIIVV